MTLRKAKPGSIFTVGNINLDIATLRRLEALGLTKGTDVRILNRNNGGSIILMVRGSRLALGSRIAESIHGV
jgi:ferrous iron transport protein A